jgi:hypothetical protein
MSQAPRDLGAQEIISSTDSKEAEYYQGERWQ